MAARLNLKHSDEVRSKIQASQLVNRLQEFALCSLVGVEDLPDNEHKFELLRKRMTKEQVNAALGLLRKIVPDLATVSGSLEVTHKTHEERLEELA